MELHVEQSQIHREIESQEQEVELHWFNFYQTLPGVIIPTITGLVSAISSFIIVIVILNSGRNTAYHRIMFLMSVCDIMSSLALSMTTLPMPSDAIYHFEGMTLGNTSTCTIQGFIQTFGTGMTLSMNGVLNVYYLCSFKFKIDEQTFKKRFEPILLILSLGFAGPPLVAFAYHGMFNPTPFESWCTVTYYPHECNYLEDVECIRGDVGFDGMGKFRFMLLGAFLIFLLGLFITMALIVWTFYKTERAFTMLERSPNAPKSEIGEQVIEDDSSKTAPNSSMSESQQAQEQYLLTKTLAKQASLYICAFLFTWVFTALTFVRVNNETATLGEFRSIQMLKLIFQPLQGFYNMSIFLYLHIYHIQKMDAEISSWHALLIIMRDPGCVPQILISQIGMLEEKNGDPVSDSDILEEADVFDDYSNEDGVSSSNEHPDDQEHSTIDRLSENSGLSFNSDNTGLSFNAS